MTLQITQMKISEIIPYERNHKKHPKTQIDKLVKQIKEHGYDVPIVIDENNVIIKGHARWQACKQLKMKTIPCIIRTDLSDEQKRAARIADNKLGELAELDIEALNAEFEHLKNMNLDVELTGFDSYEIYTTDDKSTEYNEDNPYTAKIKAPIYTIKGLKPSLDEMINLDKYNNLIKEIKDSNLSDNDRKILTLAASRHIVFNYENIAEYYAHSSKEIQNLMEKSALVIIDFNKAIENGFVKLSNRLIESCKND